MKYSELNGIDSFLFDKTSRMHIWNADPIHNKHKQEKARALANRIFNIDRSKSYTTIEIGGLRFLSCPHPFVLNKKKG